jgi:hypothetical protein
MIWPQCGQAAPHRPIAGDFWREVSHYQSAVGKLNRVRASRHGFLIYNILYLL